MTPAKSAPILPLLLFATLAIVAGNAYLAFRSVGGLQQSQAWVTHTWQVIYSLDQIRGGLKGAEAANRDFLLTGAQPDLAAFQAAKSELPADLAAFGELTADNTHQQQRLQHMREVIGIRIALLDRAVDLRASAGAAAARAVIGANRDQNAMDQVRVLSGEMQREEWALLARRKDDARANAQRARATLLFASGLDLLLLLLMLRYIQRERSLRETASNTAAQLSRLQSLSDVALSQLTLADLTAQLLTAIRQIVRADSAALGIIRDGILTVAAAEGASVTAGAEIATAGCPLLLKAISSRAPLRIDHQLGAASEICALLPDRTSSIMLAPLLQNDRVTALLIAGRLKAEAFTEGEEQLFSVTADRIALAIDRAELYENERAARRIAEESAAEVLSLNAVLEERVRQRTAELETTNKELEAFSYSVSHDLRAPLRTIDGFSLALEEDYGGIIDSTGKNYIKRVRAGVQRMGQLIDALLQLSRITRADLVLEPIDLSALVQTIADEFAQQHRDRAIQFDIEPDLSADADSHLLRAALENLLGNAVKFTSKIPKAVISFGWSTQHQAYFIRDNGAGFDQQYAGKLFHAFNRLHGDKDFTGSGIGLASVARVIARHQGRIWAEGEINHGATFWFSLGEPPSPPAEVDRPL